MNELTVIGHENLLRLATDDPDDPNHYLFGSSILWDKNIALDETERYKKIACKTIATLDEAIVLSAPGIHVYGHWLFDFIPRLLFAKAYMEQKSKKNITLVMCRPSAWANKFMNITGFINLILLKRDEQVFINNAVIPLSLKNGSFVDAFALDLTSRFIKENLPAIPNIICPRLFILRKKTIISNQEAIANMLKQYGFTCLYPEDFTIKQQVGIFQNASIVIGEDGSALHNLLFNRTKATVIMFPRDKRVNLWHTSVVKSVNAKLIIHEMDVDEAGNTVVDLKLLKV